MIYKNTQKNKGFTHQNFMKKISGGFTLIETMVAVLLLTAAIVSLLNLNATSLFASRYAKNEITANYLLQEAADYIRNDRDTIAFLQNDPTVNAGWVTFLNKYGYNNGSSPSVCFAAFGGSNGCYFEPGNTGTTINTCATAPTFGSSRCPLFNYDPEALGNDFYTYRSNASTVPAIFKRQVVFSINSLNSDELDVKVTIEWQNGTLVRSRSLVFSLLNWQK
jgi:type II secretory pathway pseudopilin PulG